MKNLIMYLIACLFVISCANDDDATVEIVVEDNEEEIVQITALNLNQEDAIDSNLPARVKQGMIFFNNEYWFMGGHEAKLQRGKTYYGDIWKSRDGIAWTKITDQAPWGPRHSFNLFEFNNELWIIGGQTGETNITWYNDVWKSADGITWEKVLDQGPWSERLEPDVQVYNNKMYLIGGHTPVNWHINQDIWESTNGRDWVKVGEISDDTLGNQQARQGIYQQGLINFKGKFLMLGGSRASTFTGFDWVLESTNGKDWSVLTKDTPWVADRDYLHMRHAQPFIFKDRLMIIFVVEDENGRKIQKLYSTEDGKDWKEELNLQRFNNDFSFLSFPKIQINAANEIMIYGSYNTAFGPLDDALHIIKLVDNQ
ncbi:Kelch repeat-containing protein [Aquimarina rhabdastrellae]